MLASSLFRGLCIATCLVTGAIAQTDPPGRVGRITYIDGTVSFHGDRESGWQKAQINYPVTSENSIWTHGNGRAEVRIGPSALRIDDDTVLDFVALHDDLTHGYLQRGSLQVRLRSSGIQDGSDRVEVETREGRFTLDGNGRYRIDAHLDDRKGGIESRIAVFAGRARFEGANGSDTRLTIEAGKQFSVRMNGPATDFRFDTLTETSFDRWADVRDREWDKTHNRYARADDRDGFISPYMTGYEDLDANGEWIDDREYGRLWSPRVVVAGWAPYRYGRWSYVMPWGWTWIDDARWGFAPFHYGRWVQIRSRWCWSPGAFIGRPVYAPALVAWFGGGVGIGGLRIGSGPAVGWFPLAPREHYIPRYTNNIHYHRRINHVRDGHTPIAAPGRYHNHVPGATVLNNQAFVSGRPVGNHRTNIPPQVIAGHAPVAHVDALRPSRVRKPTAYPQTGAPTNAPTMPQLPDRRIEGRPGNAAPGSRVIYDSTATPPTSAPISPPPANSRPPKHRAGDANNSSPPQAVPRVAPPVAPSGPDIIRTQPAPGTPDRDADRQARREARGAASRAARPSPETPPHPYPSYVPPVPPRVPAVQREQAVAPPVVKPVAERVVKPRHENPPDAVPGKNEIREGRNRSGAVKE